MSKRTDKFEWIYVLIGVFSKKFYKLIKFLHCNYFIYINALHQEVPLQKAATDKVLCQQHNEFYTYHFLWCLDLLGSHQVFSPSIRTNLFPSIFFHFPLPRDMPSFINHSTGITLILFFLPYFQMSFRTCNYFIFLSLNNKPQVKAQISTNAGSEKKAKIQAKKIKHGIFRVQQLLQMLLV